MNRDIIKVGERGGAVFRLERRIVRQSTIDTPVFVIVDFAGDLYAFLDQTAAECHWRDMDIRALADRVAA